MSLEYNEYNNEYNDEYSDWIACGCPINTHIKIIYITGVSITPNIGNLHNLESLNIINIASIPSEIGNIHSLITLDLSFNKLTSIPSEIGNLNNLQSLDLSYNKLTSIPSEIGNLHTLKHIVLSFNKLTLIPSEIGNLYNLQTIDLHSNALTSIPSEIGNLHILKILDLSFNKLTSIPSDICNLHILQTLNLNVNKLTSIPAEIGNLLTIRKLNIASNNIKYIPAEIGNLLTIRNLNIYDNPIEYIPPNVRRLLDIQTHTQGVYNDAQSVHNSTINQSIKSSIMRIISITPSLNSDCVLSSILSDYTLTDFTKQSLVEYTQNTDLISEVNVTFLEVLTAIWNRIVTNEHSTDIKKVLNGEMEDAECKCFTGRVSRLVNCLSGFDALVEVKIADNEQIGNVIAAVGDRLKASGRYTVEIHKETARVDLKELGYTEEFVRVWLDYIE